jgi:hypothetical protein
MLTDHEKSKIGSLLSSVVPPIEPFADQNRRNLIIEARDKIVIQLFRWLHEWEFSIEEALHLLQESERNAALLAPTWDYEDGVGECEEWLYTQEQVTRSWPDSHGIERVHAALAEAREIFERAEARNECSAVFRGKCHPRITAHEREKIANQMVKAFGDHLVRKNEELVPCRCIPWPTNLRSVFGWLGGEGVAWRDAHQIAGDVSAMFGVEFDRDIALEAWISKAFDSNPESLDWREVSFSVRSACHKDAQFTARRRGYLLKGVEMVKLAVKRAAKAEADANPPVSILDLAQDNVPPYRMRLTIALNGAPYEIDLRDDEMLTSLAHIKSLASSQCRIVLPKELTPSAWTAMVQVARSKPLKAEKSKMTAAIEQAIIESTQLIVSGKYKGEKWIRPEDVVALLRQRGIRVEKAEIIDFLKPRGFRSQVRYIGDNSEVRQWVLPSGVIPEQIANGNTHSPKVTDSNSNTRSEIPSQHIAEPVETLSDPQHSDAEAEEWPGITEEESVENANTTHPGQHGDHTTGVDGPNVDGDSPDEEIQIPM